MGRQFRSTVQLAVTFVSAVVVARAVDSARQVQDDLPLDRSHPGVPTVSALLKEPTSRPWSVMERAPRRSGPQSFGPELSAKISPGIGFMPTPVPPTHNGVVREVREVPALPPTERHRQPRDEGTVSGLVTDVLGDGLSGMRVDVIDKHKVVVDTATTGAKGEFVIDRIPIGTYRLRALDDVNGDFERSWYGGRTSGAAEPFKVKSGKKRGKLVVVLRFRAHIDVETTVKKRKIKAMITVTHHANGGAATGIVEVSTKGDNVTLPLVDGKAAVSLKRSVKKLKIDYAGDHQTRASSTKVRVRRPAT